jgi:hypothetical protein
MVRARAEGPFCVDLGAFPLVRIHSPSASEYEHVDVQSFFTAADAAMARRSPFAVLHDARDMPYVDEPRQARFLEELQRRRLLIGKYMRAYAAVVSSPRERGLITALGWSAHLPLPTRLFSNEPEASAFLLARCTARPLAKTRARQPEVGPSSAAPKDKVDDQLHVHDP